MGSIVQKDKTNQSVHPELSKDKLSDIDQLTINKRRKTTVVSQQIMSRYLFHNF